MLGLISPRVARSGLLALRPMADAEDERMYAANPNGSGKMPGGAVFVTGQKRPPMADAMDEAMYAANPNGTPENQAEGAALLAAEASGLLSPAAQPQTAPAQGLLARPRVSGWRILDRVLGGETISQGLDSERSRLRTEAMRPQVEARMETLRQLATRMGPAAQIAFETNPEKFGESLAAQYAPQVIAAGGIQSIAGSGQRVGAVSTREFGDRIATTDPITGQTTYSDPRPATYDEQTKRLAASTANVAQDGRLVDTRTGEIIAEGIQRPDIQNIAPGGTALAFDANGNVINSVASQQQRPQSQAEMKRADELELALTADENSIARVEQALASITDPDGPGPARAAVNISPIANVVGGLRNAAGVSNANSLGIADIKTTVESLRQGILNDATGPQTEGDALRALSSILAGINDPDVVAQGFNDYLTAKRRTAAVRRQQLDRIRSGVSGASQGGIISVSSPAEAQALPAGTQFRTPDGQIRVKR